MVEEGKKYDAGKRSPIDEYSLSHELAHLSDALGRLVAKVEVLRPTTALDYLSVSMNVHLASDVISFGAMKYGPGNWRHVEHGRRRYSDAFWRHALSSIYYPESPIVDQESGFTHEAHALCNLIFLSWDGLR